MNRGYLNALSMCVSIFAAGGIVGSVSPVFVLMMEELGVSALRMGLLAGASLVGFALLGGALVIGSDKLITREGFGTLVTFLMGGVVLSGLVPLFTHSYWILWFSRLLAGLCCIGLALLMLILAVEWFIERLNFMVVMGIVSMVLGVLVVSFFGSLMSEELGGWEVLPACFGVVGMGALGVWIKGEPLPFIPDGGAPPPSSPLRVLKNRGVWYSSLILYTLLSYLGVFTFVFVALAGRWDVAVMSKRMTFPTPFYIAAAINSFLLIFAASLFLSVAEGKGRRRTMCVVSGLLGPLFAFVALSLPFSGMWIGVVLEMIMLALLQLAVIIPVWVIELQELPGVTLDLMIPAIGAILAIAGAMGALVPCAIGWALDQGWSTFETILKLSVLSWTLCALAGFLLIKPEYE